MQQVQRPPAGGYDPATENNGDGQAGDEDEDDEGEEESDESVAKRCHELMKQSDVVLFMKGDRNTPRWVATATFSDPEPRRLIRSYLSVGSRSFVFFCRCGFSQKMIGILSKQPGLEYTTFDILSDEAVRQSKHPRESASRTTRCEVHTF